MSFFPLMATLLSGRTSSCETIVTSCSLTCYSSFLILVKENAMIPSINVGFQLSDIVISNFRNEFRNTASMRWSTWLNPIYPQIGTSSFQFLAEKSRKRWRTQYHGEYHARNTCARHQMIYFVKQKQMRT